MERVNNPRNLTISWQVQGKQPSMCLWFISPWLYSSIFFLVWELCQFKSGEKTIPLSHFTDRTAVKIIITCVMNHSSKVGKVVNKEVMRTMEKKKPLAAPSKLNLPCWLIHAKVAILLLHPMGGGASSWKGLLRINKLWFTSPGESFH